MNDQVHRLRDHVNYPHLEGDICLRCWAADEIERLRAELEQANVNLQHARTGKALLDLEQERARTAHLRDAFTELAEMCQRLLTERFNDMTEGTGDTPTPTPNLTRIDL